MNKNIIPLIIFNFTPDSFSDGGELGTLSKVQSKIQNALSAKVKAFDFGACSTAPMNSIISQEEEKERLQKFLFPCKNLLPDEVGYVYSFDTFYPENMQFLMKEFSTFKKSTILWNDVSGVFDDETIKILLENSSLSYVYNFTFLSNKMNISQHRDFMRNDIDIAESMHSAFRMVKDKFKHFKLSNSLILDPGIGFSKNAKQDLKLLNLFLTDDVELKHDQYLIGISRKSFLATLHENNLDKTTSLKFRESAQVKILTDFFKLHPSYKLYWRLHDMALFDYAVKLHQSLT